MLHALVHGIASLLSLNPAVYVCALGSALATPTDFGAHDYSWWSGTAGEGAMASCGWVGWGEQRYEAHLRWLDASDPSGHSRHRLDLQMLAAAACLSFEDEVLCAGEQSVNTIDAVRWCALRVCSLPLVYSPALQGCADEVAQAILRRRPRGLVPLVRLRPSSPRRQHVQHARSAARERAGSVCCPP